MLNNILGIIVMAILIRALYKIWMSFSKEERDSIIKAFIESIGNSNNKFKI